MSTPSARLVEVEGVGGASYRAVQIGDTLVFGRDGGTPGVAEAAGELVVLHMADFDKLVAVAEWQRDMEAAEADA